MANKARGEVSFHVGEREYVLVYTINALCEIEDALGFSVSDMEERLRKPSARDIRALLWAGLMEHHPEITLQQAGSLESPLPEMVAAVTRAMEAAFDRGGVKGAAGGSAAGGARPRKAARGTG